mgnify:CR=1 FL=1
MENEIIGYIEIPEDYWTYSHNVEYIVVDD